MLARFVCPASKLRGIGDLERRLSIVLDGDVPPDPRVESVETRIPVDFGGDVYVEFRPGDDLDTFLSGLAERRLFAKVRCGGANVPTVAELAAFVRGCREHAVAFKATAGLHHAYPTPSGEHGFLNLLGAAVFGEEEEALRAPPGAFALDSESFRWGARSATPAELVRARRELFHSIGTCSFFEPVAELHELGMLP